MATFHSLDSPKDVQNQRLATRERKKLGLDVSIPSSRFGRRGFTPAFGYGAPHPSAGGTSTLLTHALPSAHYGGVRLLTPVHHALRLFEPSARGPGRRKGLWSGVRSPRFRRDPFVRDVASRPRQGDSASHNGAAHVAFDVEHRLGPCDIQDFVAQSHTPHDCCVRFAPAVADRRATLACRRALPLTCAGLPPAGSRQLRLARVRALLGGLLPARSSATWIRRQENWGSPLALIHQADSLGLRFENHHQRGARWWRKGCSISSTRPTGRAMA